MRIAGALFVFAAGLQMMAAQVAVAGADPTEELESRLRDDLVKTVARQPSLRGVWVDVRRTEDEGFQLETIADSDSHIEKMQLEQLTMHVQSVVGSVPFEVEIADRLPFRQFVSDLRMDVELDSGLAGASVEDAYLTVEPGSDELIVILVGRVMNDSQRDQLTELSNQQLSLLLAKSQRPIQLTKTRIENLKIGIVQQAPSGEVAQLCFGNGVRAFTRKKYSEAYEQFTHAHVESPARLDIQYWRTICLIGGDREADAKRLLQGVVKANRRSGSLGNDPQVFRSLELVQGPLRWKLTALEDSLLSSPDQ